MILQLMQGANRSAVLSDNQLKKKASHLSIAALVLLLFPMLIDPVKAQTFTTDELQNLEMPVGNYIQELHAIDDEQLLSIVEDFKAASIDPSQSVSLSLDRCVSLAFANNPNLKARIEILKSRRDDLIAESRTWNPTASINGSSNALNNNRGETRRIKRSRSVETPLTPLTDTQRTSSENRYSQTIRGEVQWTFLDFTRQPKINAAASNYTAERYQFYTTSRLLVYEIQQTYYQLLAQRELINSFEIIVKALKSTLDVTDNRFEAGRTHLQDLGQIHAQYYSTLSDLTSYIQTYYQLSSRLAKLVSLPDQTLIVAEGSNQFVGEWTLDLEESVDLARLKNDRLLSSQELAKASNSRGIAQLNSTLPNLFLTAGATLSSGSSDGYTFNKTTTSGSRSSASNSSQSDNTFSFGNNSSYDVSGGIGFSWNFYQGGVNNARASSQFAQSKSQEFQTESIYDELISDIRTSMNALKSNRLRYLTSDASTQSAKISYIAAIARLNAGLSDVTTVNQIIQTYQSSIQSEIRAIQNYNIELAKLYRDTAIWPKEATGLALELLESTGLDR